jgi:alpha-methylacyl-CoA racemase
VQPLAGALVVDLTRYTPGPFASRELRRLGARVVRIEPPEGDPLRLGAPTWHAALDAGKESVVCDLKSADGLALANALCGRADVVLDGFRPGVLERLGVRIPETAVLCAITGFGESGRHIARAGHDLNYAGWGGLLADTAPALPPTQVADLCAGSYGAVVEILAALLERARTGRGARLTVSMTHGAHRLVAHRLAGDPLGRLLTGGLACYRIYASADGRYVTLAALEPWFFARACEVVGRPELAERQYDADQEALGAELAAAFAKRTLADWLERFEGEDACVGPVWTIEEAAREFGSPAEERAPALGEHTDAWRRELARDG